MANDPSDLRDVAESIIRSHRTGVVRDLATRLFQTGMADHTKCRLTNHNGPNTHVTSLEVVYACGCRLVVNNSPKGG